VLVREFPTAAIYTRYLGGYNVPTTVFGKPSLSYPIGGGENNLPVGVQIHAPRYSDIELVDFSENLKLARDLAEISSKGRSN
jgi:Asp-tRNA(Asn)/Glu-tRNA(Gln) amidotransferase A subunit family amidase